jgi:hypothetical protein
MSIDKRLIAVCVLFAGLVATISYTSFTTKKVDLKDWPLSAPKIHLEIVAADYTLPELRRISSGDSEFGSRHIYMENFKILQSSCPSNRVQNGLAQMLQSRQLFLSMEPDLSKGSAKFYVATPQTARTMFGPDIVPDQNGAISVMNIEPSMFDGTRADWEIVRAWGVMDHEMFHYEQYLMATMTGDTERIRWFTGTMQQGSEESCSGHWQIEIEASDQECLFMAELGLAQQSFCPWVLDEAQFKQAFFLAHLRDDVLGTGSKCDVTFAKLAGHPQPEAFQ